MNKILFIKSYSKQEINSAKAYLTERYYKHLRNISKHFRVWVE